MHLSLQTKLNELQRRAEGFEVVSSNEDSIPGEGRLTYKGQRVEYVADYTSPREPSTQLDHLLAADALSFSTPHDIAWSPTEKVVLAYAASQHGPFTLISAPLKMGSVVPLEDRLALEE